MAQPTEIRVSVGDAVNRALYVLRTDTGQFSSDADLLIASGVLRNLITASSAGVSTLNDLSGIVSLSGVGGTTVYTGANGVIYISGSGGAASLTGTAIYSTDTGNFATSLALFQSGQYLWAQLGNLSGQGALYALKTDTGNFVSQTQTGGLASSFNLSQTGQTLLSASGVLRSDLVNTGATLEQRIGVLSGYAETTYAKKADTGNFVSQTQTGGLASAFNLSLTGQYLWTQLGNLSGLGATLYALKADTGNFVSSTQTGQFASDSDLLYASGYIVSLISAASAGVSSLAGLSGVISLTAAGNISITTGVGNITISGATGDLATAVNLATTGQTLATSLYNLSGLAVASYALKTDTGDFVSRAGTGFLSDVFSRVSATGSNPVLAPNFTGAGSVTVSLLGSTVFVSGAAAASTGTPIYATDTGGFATSLTLAATGQTISTNVYNLSGLAAATYALKADTGNFVSAINTGFLANVFSKVSITGSNTILTPMFTGLGNVTVSMTGSVVQISGVSSSTTGTLVYSTDTGSFVTTLQTGQLTGAFVSLVGGAATIQGGATIANGQLLIGASGSGANCFQQGDLYGQSGIVVTSGSGFLGLSIDQSLFALASATGNFVSAANTGFLANVFSRVSITGSPTVLAPAFTGAGSVTVSILGSTVTISGGAAAQTGTIVYATDTGAFSTSLQLATTGQTLATNIYNLSGLAATSYALKTDTGNFVSAVNTGFLGNLASKVSATGSSFILAPNLTGAGSVSVSLLGSTITISGSATANTGTLVYSTDTGSFATILNLATSGQTLATNIYNLSGLAAASYALKQDTGNFVSQTQTGGLATVLNLAATGQTISTNLYNLSGFYNRFTVTGTRFSPLDFSGAGGVRVFTTGTSLFFSGEGLALAANTGNFVSRTDTGAYNTWFALAGATGNFLSRTDTGNFASIQNLALTGQTLATHVYNLSGLSAATYALKADTGNFVSKTETGLYNSNFSKVSVTGGSIVLAPNFTGAGSVTVSALGNTITVSGTASTGGSVGTQIKQFGFSLDGATTLTSGIKGYSICPYAGTISSWTLSSRTTGGITVDVYKSGFGNLPTNSIITDNYPKLTGNQFQLSSSLVGWSTSVSQNDTFGWFIHSGVTGASQVSFTLNITL